MKGQRLGRRALRSILKLAIVSICLSLVSALVRVDHYCGSYPTAEMRRYLMQGWPVSYLGTRVGTDTWTSCYLGPERDWRVWFDSFDPRIIHLNVSRSLFELRYYGHPYGFDVRLFLLNTLVWVGLVYAISNLLKRINWRVLYQKIAYWLWNETYEPRDWPGKMPESKT